MAGKAQGAKATIEAGTNAASKRGRGTGKPFATGEDSRRNNAGQRNREVVATASQARDLYVKLLHEAINQPIDKDMTNLELICRQHVKSARNGDQDARELLFNRIWGKASQPMDLTSSDGSMTPLPAAFTFIPYVKPDTDSS